MGELRYDSTCDGTGKEKSKSFSKPEFTKHELSGLKNLTEYDLQKDNGVLDKLESAALYTANVFPGSSIKRKLDLNLFTRPLTGYNIECDVSRQDLLERVNVEADQLYSKFYNLNWRMTAFAITIIQLNFYVFCGSIGHPIGHFVGIIVGNTFNFGFSYPVWIRLVEMKKMVDKRVSLPQSDLDVYNACLDRNVRMSQFNNKIDDIFELQSSVSFRANWFSLFGYGYIVSIIFLFLVGVSTGLSSCGCCRNCHSSEVRDFVKFYIYFN